MHTKKFNAFFKTRVQFRMGAITRLPNGLYMFQLHILH